MSAIGTTVAAASILMIVAAPILAQSTVKGTYKANGKDAKIAYVWAKKDEPFSGKDTVRLVLSEMDASKQKNPDITASFGKLGSALVLRISRDGDVFGCEVAHTALKRMGASSIGKLKTEGFQWTGSTVKGRLTTGGPVDLFDEKWEVDLTFETKIP